MKKLTSGVLTGALAAALAASMTQAPAAAAPSEGDAPGASAGTPAAQRPDNRPGPLTKEQTALRQAALEALVDGSGTKTPQRGGGSTVTLGQSGGKVKAVEFFDNDKQANVLTILSEFGETVVGKYGGAPGPLHNKIPEPNRSEDNSTTWEADYNMAYYEKLFNGSGESMKTYYDTVSGGQYDVTNTVEDWVKVPYNGAYYGANPREDQGGAWDFIEDTGNSWYADKVAEFLERGMTNAQAATAVDEYLAQFDQWDRYDFNDNGNFNEPDGYIDHFQAVHAGEGEEAGASPDTIWSHRWYVNGTDFGQTGPTVDGTPVKFGGAQIGQSKYWLGDYTVEPENGGLGVFVHEYGHDLDLPDFYDTAGGDNGTAFWTVMSGGSWMGHGEAAGDGIGTTPSGMGPDEKLFLGWLDHQRLPQGKSGKFTLSPASNKTAAAGTTQAVLVELPDENVVKPYTTPPEGSHAWWSGRADNLNNTLTRPVPGASSVTVTASAWYQIEAGYDYLYGEYSTDNGQTWKSAGAPIDGNSRSWQNVSWSYRPNGQATLFQLRYQTDGGVNEAGAFLDNIVVSADRTTVVADGAENGDNGWAVKGWTRSTGTDSYAAKQYYLLENRQHVGFDSTLGTGPYNFTGEFYNKVEFFKYQPGMLVWFADKRYGDNNTSEHPGHGQALPVDARPKRFVYKTSDGTVVGAPGNRRQPFDATFGLQQVDLGTPDDCLHTKVMIGNGANATPETATACPTDLDPKPTFHDSSPTAYWDKTTTASSWSSTMTAGSGLKATVLKQDGNNLLISVTR